VKDNKVVPNNKGEIGLKK